MTDPTAPRVDLSLDPTVDLDALEQALLRARSAELTEVRRRQVRLTAGYGDETARGVMDDQAARAQLRYDALSAVLEALRRTRQ